VGLKENGIPHTRRCGAARKYRHWYPSLLGNTNRRVTRPGGRLGSDEEGGKRNGGWGGGETGGGDRPVIGGIGLQHLERRLVVRKLSTGGIRGKRMEDIGKVRKVRKTGPEKGSQQKTTDRSKIIASVLRRRKM